MGVQRVEQEAGQVGKSVVVVDGGSRDETADRAREAGELTYRPAQRLMSLLQS